MIYESWRDTQEGNLRFDIFSIGLLNCFPFNHCYGLFKTFISLLDSLSNQTSKYNQTWSSTKVLDIVRPVSDPKASSSGTGSENETNAIRPKLMSNYLKGINE